MSFPASSSSCESNCSISLNCFCIVSIAWGMVFSTRMFAPTLIRILSADSVLPLKKSPEPRGISVSVPGGVVAS